jgi:hypothetical protein
MSPKTRFSVESSIATVFASVVAIADVAHTMAAQTPISLPSFPGTFISAPLVSRDLANPECLALGDDTFNQDVVEVGACRSLGLHEIGRASGVAWAYATYERRWLLTPSDTVSEREVVLFSKSAGDSSRLRPIWHYRYETEMLRSVTPEVVFVSGGAALLSVDECVNGTGGCSQSFAIFKAGSPKEVRLAFLDSLRRRFPDGIRHGFHVDLRTLHGSTSLYSGSDRNCCPSTIGEFSLRLKGNSLELTTLKLRRAN